MSTTRNTNRANSLRYVLVSVAVIAVFVGAYAFAATRSGSPAARTARAIPKSAGLACACCGSSAPTANGVTGAPATSTATVEAGVQRVSVDLSKGYYDPNTIELKAGVPAEITFGQSAGCTGQVVSSSLGFSEDLTAGPKTVKLPALTAGEYQFSCGMQMVFGKIVVK